MKKDECISLIGEKYGRFTLIEYLGKDKNQKPRFKCLCDCGNIKDVDIYALKSGSVQSCGCYHKEKLSKMIKKDMIGKKFGHLTVIQEVKPIGGCARYLCKCDCGNEIHTDGTSLRRENRSTKSCGCVDGLSMIGEVFGRLTVVKKAESKINDKKHSYWFCQCSCNNKELIIVSKDHLVSGHTKSCGCITKERLHETYKKYNDYNTSGEYGIGYTFKGEEFYFDLDDYNLIKNYCWMIGQNGYVVSDDIYLHRIIFQTKKDEVTDHINRNKLDNRKTNLRSTRQQNNTINKSLQKNNITGVAGVWWDEKTNNWRSYLTKSGKTYCEHFDDFEDAVYNRLLMEVKYFGEFAPQKHLYKQYGIKEI